MGIDSLNSVEGHAEWTVPSSAYDSKETPDSPESRAVKAEEFIFKLARDPNIADEDAIQGIIRQLEALKGNQNLSAVVDTIDPIQFHSETNLLDEAAKNRLTKALESWSGQFSH